MEKEAPKLYIKVAIIDDDKSYRDSLKTLLSKDSRIRIYGEYSSAEEFMSSMGTPFIPDVCLMDIVLKKMSGIECIKQMKEKFPKITFIIMTAYPDSDSFAEARAIGVDYIEKGTCLEYLIDKIITTKENSQVEKQSNVISISKKQKGTLKSLEIINKFEEVKKRVDELSDTQKEVMKLKLEGKSNQEIALLLNIGEGTVHTHISRALKKLNPPNFLDFILDEL